MTIEPLRIKYKCACGKCACPVMDYVGPFVCVLCQTGAHEPVTRVEVRDEQ